METKNDDRLALEIGHAMLNAIKACQPEPRIVEVARAHYMTPQQLVWNYGKCLSTIRNLIKEIRYQVELGRYPADSVLDGCGVCVRTDVFNDYLKHRKALKDPVACKYVPLYEEVKE